MPAPSLDGAERKIARAKEQFAQIDAAVEEWKRAIENPPFGFITHDPDGDVQSVDITLKAPVPIDPSMALALGDAVHNLRTALDHAALQLALRFGASMADCWQQTSFPIYDDSHKFESWKGRIVKHIPAHVLAELQTLQPYEIKKQSGRDCREAVLWTLAELDNIDKHRVILVIGELYKVHSIEVKVDGKLLDRSLTTIPAHVPTTSWAPMVDGTILGTVAAPRRKGDRPKKMDVRVDMATDVRIRETGLVLERRGISEVGETLLQYVTTLVGNIKSEYFK